MHNVARLNFDAIVTNQEAYEEDFKYSFVPSFLTAIKTQLCVIREDACEEVCFGSSGSDEARLFTIIDLMEHATGGMILPTAVICKFAVFKNRYNVNMPSVLMLLMGVGAVDVPDNGRGIPSPELLFNVRYEERADGKEFDGSIACIPEVLTPSKTFIPIKAHLSLLTKVNEIVENMGGASSIDQGATSGGFVYKAAIPYSGDYYLSIHAVISETNLS